MIKDNISSELCDWTKKKIEGGRTFEEVFNIDGISLWWFYKPLLFFGGLPKGLKSYVEIKQKIYCKEDYPFWSKIKSKMWVFGSKKFLYYNEKAKSLFYRKNKITYNNDFKVPKTLFISYTNYLKNPQSKEYLRIGSLTNLLSREKKVFPYVLEFDPLSRLPRSKLKENENMIFAFGENINKKRLWDEAENKSKEWSSLKDKETLIPFYNLIQPHLNLLFSKELVYVTLFYYETVKAVLERYNFNLVFLTGDGSLIERCCIAAAHSKNIPTLLNSHGYISPIVADYCSFENSYFAVFGQEQKDLLVKNGFPEGRISITGSLVFDQEFKIKTIEDKKVPDNKIKIAFFTQAAVEKKMIGKKLYFEQIKIFLDKLINIPNVEVTIKLHPAERFLKEYIKIIKSLKSNQIKIATTSSTQLTRDSNLIVTFRSSVLYGAIIANKPVICLDTLDENIKNRYDIEKEVKDITTINVKMDIKSVIENMLSEDNLNEILDKQRAYLSYLFSHKDGQSDQRIAKLIYQILRVK